MSERPATVWRPVSGPFATATLSAMTDERGTSTASNSPSYAEELAVVSTKADLARCMKRLKEDGRISLRELETWGLNHGRPLARASVGDALAGRRLPSERLLRDFLNALKVQEPGLRRAWFEALSRAQTAEPTDRSRSYAERATGPVPARNFFVETDDVDEIYRSVTSIQDQVWLLGTTLSRHIPYLEEPLRRAVANGRRARILLISPGSAAMDMSVLRAGPLGSGREQQEQQLTSNLNTLRQVAQAGSGLEVRLIDYLAPYTLYAYDPGLDIGRMELRLGSFHGEHHLRPTFQVQRSRDESWFAYFYEQFVSMWDAAEPYDLGR
ncbi:hypothetical protein KOI35_25030 [Actinoplanes bogorensis]|uniref:XRE family transcriptional regulator n=1 Tax=Paractinoplanes bogorensis TaxID=1610840 RepID=A0ABS5YTK5_9ACTN|nr:hypothetical protein [Actinoplanes bogorensis]MBU2666778.1 hypothetical protein [Actinoplanes bogorensis]